MKTSVSRAYRKAKQIGWRKTIGGRDWFLVYGTTPADEAKAIKLANIMKAKLELIRAAGGMELTQTDFEEAKGLVDGLPRRHDAQEEALAAIMRSPVVLQPVPSAPVQPPPSVQAVPQQPVAVAAATDTNGTARRWLFASIDQFVSNTMRKMKADGSNGDHVINTCERVLRARDAIEDIPLDLIRRKELDEWLLEIRGLKSKLDGKPIGPHYVRNLVTAVRMALSTFAQWEWWTPPVLWEKAFSDYSLKKMQTPTERKAAKRKRPAHTIDEKRILWHLGLPFDRAMMALADWAGHTQTEIATMTFDEMKQIKGEMYIKRDRNKTGVPGRWWIPPEAAAVIRAVVAKTPRDPGINPKGLAFLTPRNMPLVHRADKNKKARSDYVGSNRWHTLLRAAFYYNVRHISFKFMRKATAQRIRRKYGKEVSRTFLAHADEDIQDEHYTSASLKKVERAVRALHPSMKAIFEPLNGVIMKELSDRIAQKNAERLAKGTNVPGV